MPKACLDCSGTHANAFFLLSVFLLCSILLNALMSLIPNVLWARGLRIHGPIKKTPEYDAGGLRVKAVPKRREGCNTYVGLYAIITRLYSKNVYIHLKKES